ncbi:helix-turn-helix domain-containing protein [Pseudomonas sp. NMS19W]|uniref:helix-turn-helix domain-containing protein n=1 Tax=Pseudomonas sp. NMS19W TaxID=3079768 RepID=UPI003F654EAA
MNTENSPNDLGEFLRARRSELEPTQSGLPNDAGRTCRVAGLRREEVAMLAGISVDYCTRLEQGVCHRWQIVSCAESPDQAIIGLTAAPGSATDEALNRLTAGIFPRNAKRPMQCTGRFEGETSVDRFQNQPGYLVW